MDKENELLIKYKPLVLYVWAKKIKKCRLINFWKEDILEEGKIGLLYAIKNYKEGKASFLNYACICIYSKMAVFIRHLNKEYGIGNPSTVSLQKLDNTTKCIVGGVEEKIVDKISLEELRRITPYIIYRLSYIRKRTIHKLLEGKTQSQVARELDISRQAVNSTWKTFLEKYNDYISKN